jgi:hypothetical protein
MSVTAYRERQTIGIDRSSPLILSCFDLFGSAAEPDRLAQ